MLDLKRRLRALSSKKRELILKKLQEKKALSVVSVKYHTTSIQRAPRDKAIWLSFAQERLWFLDQLDPGSPVYNIPIVIHLNGLLNVSALELSLNEIIRRHEVLRTTFSLADGQPVQIINPVSVFKMIMVDLCELPVEELRVKIQLLINEEIQQPFDLARGPLFRVKFLRIKDEEYIFILNIHHIIFDAWSMDIFLRELTVLYKVFSVGNPSPLSELPIQYADFVVWQRGWLQGEVLEKQLAYWKQQLEGAPSVLELPTDRSRPAVQSFRGAWQSIKLSKSLSEFLKALSRQEGVTLFMTLLAAFKTLLYRYTGQDDIVIGSPIANRNQVEIEGLIGFFVNTLVLRTDLSGNPTFLELLARVREMTLDAYEHQDLPFEKLVEELQPERDLGHSPLFEVMFVYQKSSNGNLVFPGVTVTYVPFGYPIAKFDWTMSITDSEQNLTVGLEYNTDLFKSMTIIRMLEHFKILLEGIIAKPDAWISDLPFITKTERHQLLFENNDTNRDYSNDRCIHQLFEEQAKKTPDAVAVVYPSTGSGQDGNKQLTYHELNARANQLAHQLRYLGVGPEVIVGICMARSLEMVVGLLGILKAGGAYLALDPMYPKERLAFMLSNSQVQVLLTQKKLSDKLPKNRANVICLDSDWETIAQRSEENPITSVSSSNLAYVIYTSGSTGEPKGVAIEHRSTVTLLHWARDNFASDDFGRVLFSTSICFDLSVFELFVPLSWGGKVILVQNVLDLPKISETANITLINTVPSAITELVRTNSIPTSVRTINLAGEPLKNPLVQKIYKHDNIERVFDLYGPSEDTTYSTFVLRRKDGPETIGRPIANTKVYILDNYLQPVPIGVRGELYISGNGLARGYFGRPDLTAEKFISNPFNDKSGARLYKTGDLARYLPDGNIEFLGRIDHQVKMRGYRIELGEIESVLSRHEAIKDCVVLVQDSELRDKNLIAYVVCSESVSSLSLRRFLREKLPGYMIPARFIQLDEIPLNPNGKVNYKQLRKLASLYKEERIDFVPPESSVEKAIAKIWQKELKVDKVGVHDNFFDLGGHSLLAIRVASKTEDELKRQIPLREFFNQTLGQIAAGCEEKMAKNTQRDFWHPDHSD